MKLNHSKCASKKVIDTITKIIYNSIKEAAEAFNINQGTLSGYLNGTRKNKTSLIFLTDYKEED